MFRVNNFFQKFFVSFFVVALFLPIVSFAIVDGDPRIVPCGYDGARSSAEGGNPTSGEIDPNEECNFYDFISMINIVIIGTIMMVSIYAAISFMYAGYAYLTSGGSQEKVSYAKGIFKKVLIGYIIILSAWGFVKMFENAMLKNEFLQKSFLEGGKGN